MGVERGAKRKGTSPDELALQVRLPHAFGSDSSAKGGVPHIQQFVAEVGMGFYQLSLVDVGNSYDLAIGRQSRFEMRIPFLVERRLVEENIHAHQPRRVQPFDDLGQMPAGYGRAIV